MQAEKTKSAAISQIAKKPTYADIAAGESKQVIKKTAKPWILIQKKRAISAIKLAPKKAIEPYQRRIIFKR
jgi:hypothetical protein